MFRFDRRLNVFASLTQLQLHWQQLKSILGEEVLDLLEHHQFAHHSFETTEHKHGIHARQVLYALKHYFYLLLLFDAAKEKGDDQALARSAPAPRSA